MSSKGDGNVAEQARNGGQRWAFPEVAGTAIWSSLQAPEVANAAWLNGRLAVLESGRGCGK